MRRNEPTATTRGVRSAGACGLPARALRADGARGVDRAQHLQLAMHACELAEAHRDETGSCPVTLGARDPEAEHAGAVVVVAPPRVQRCKRDDDLLGALAVVETELEREVRPVLGLGFEDRGPLVGERVPCRAEP